MDIFRFSQSPSDLAAFEDTFRFAAFTVVRFAAFSAHAIIFGFVPLSLLVLRPVFSTLQGERWARARSRVAARCEGMIQSALSASAVVTLVAVVLQAVLIAESGDGSFTTDSFMGTLETTFGQWYFIRFPLLGALAVILVGRVGISILAGAGDEKPSPGKLWWGAWAALAGLLLLTSTFSGHAAVGSPRLVSLANDALHLMSGAVWFTGIVILALVLPDAWRGSGSDADRLQVLAPAVLRFSSVAAVTITILAVTGTLNSFLHVGAFRDLIDTGYGRTLAIKIVLFLVVLALGGVNHYIIKDRLDRALKSEEGGDAARVFRKTIAAELVLALVVMGVTGILVGLGRTKETPLPAETASVTSGSKS
jgi:putative copper export protein